MLRNITAAVALVLALAVPASAGASTRPEFVPGPTLKLHAGKLTKLQAKHLTVGTVVKPNFIPNDGSGLPYPPVPCAWYLDGIGMAWGGVLWGCQCPTRETCQWVEEGEDPYLPNGYVYRPPSGVMSVCWIS